jgi:predicted permease
MMISSKGRYALHVMVDLAQHDGEGLISLKAVAQRQGLSLKYLENIVSVLTHAGLLHCTQIHYPALVALFGSPVAVSSAIMASSMKNDGQLAAQLVVWTSIFSIFTIFAEVCILMMMGLLAV